MKTSLSFKQAVLAILLIAPIIGIITLPGLDYITPSNSTEENSTVEKSGIEQLEPVPYNVNYGVASEDVEWRGETISLQGRPYMGNEDAKVSMVAYEDYFCPWCAGFHNQNFAKEIDANSPFDKIMENYVETGQVRYYFKNFPVVGGKRPAEVSECVANHGTPESFWKFNYNHFQNYRELAEIENSNTSEYDKLMVSWSRQLDIDSAEFKACIEENKRDYIVQSDMREGNNIGVDSTPTNVIDGELISGTQSYNTYKTIIEDKLNE